MAKAGNFDTNGLRGDEKRVRDKFWHTAKRAARHVPFMEDVTPAHRLAAKEALEELD